MGEPLSISKLGKAHSLAAFFLLLSVLALFAGVSSQARADPTSWNAPHPIDESSHESYRQVSCVSASMCTAIDDAGNVFVYDNRTWSAGRDVDPGHTVVGVSCPTASFCMLVDNDGDAVTTTDPEAGAHATWSAPEVADLGAGLSSVSCASASFCVAVANGSAVTFDDGRWEAPVTILGAGNISSVSCASAALCAAVDQSGNTILDENGTWQGVDHLSSYGFNSASCAPDAFCVAANEHGEVAELVAGAWSAMQVLDPADAHEEEEEEYDNGIESVSCAASTFCVALDQKGEEITLNEHGWNPPAALGAGKSASRSVSCTSASFCLAAGTGDVYTYDGTAWSAAIAVDPVPTPTHSLTCVSTLCLAGDSSGSVVTSTDTGIHWGQPLSVEPGGGGIGGASCPSSGFCAVLNGGTSQISVSADPEEGAAATWTSPDTIEYDHVMSGIACASAKLCIAINGEGDALTSTDPEEGPSAVWSTPRNISGPTLFAMTCPSTTLCVGLDYNGHVVTSTNPAAGSGASWESEVIFSSTHGPSAISCPSTTLCVAVNGLGEAEITTDPADGATATWSKLAAAGGEGEPSSISCPTTTLCAVGDTVGDVSFIGSPEAGSNATWSSKTAVDQGKRLDVACSTVTECVSIDEAGYTAHTTVAPTNTTAPALSSQLPKLGAPLTVSDGEWSEPSGSGTITYTYQWYDCDGVGAECAAIEGATLASYKPRVSDGGSTLRAAVIATNNDGSSPSSLSDTSDVVSTVTAAPVLLEPTASESSTSPLTVRYRLPEEAVAGSLELTFTSSERVIVVTPAAGELSSGEHTIQLSTHDLTANSAEVASATESVLPDATYTVSLAYRDLAENPAATATATGVKIITTTAPPTLESPTAGSEPSGDFPVIYYLPEAATPGSVKLVFTGENLVPNTIVVSKVAQGEHAIVIDPRDPDSEAGVVSGPLTLPYGKYSLSVQYQDEFGNPAASVTVDSITLLNPNLCQAGFYSSSTEAPCTEATAGHYVDTIGATSQTSCEAGTFNPDNGSTAVVDCLPADRGHYVELTGQSTELDCPIGTFASVAHSEHCLNAEPGHYVAYEGAALQQECAAGTYNASQGESSCATTPANTYSGVGAIEPVPCAKGTESAPGSSSCTAVPTAEPKDETKAEAKTETPTAMPTTTPSTTAPPAAHPTPAHEVAPAIAALEINHRCVAPVTLLPAGRDARGLKVSFQLNEMAEIHESFERDKSSPTRTTCPPLPGHAKGREKAWSGSTSRGVSKSEEATITSSTSLAGGSHAIPLAAILAAAHVNAHRLRPGAYILTIAATDAEGESSPAQAAEIWIA